MGVLREASEKVLAEHEPSVGQISGRIIGCRCTGVVFYQSRGESWEQHVAEAVEAEVHRRLEAEVEVMAGALADMFDRDEAYSIGERLDRLSDVRAWLA